MRALQQPPTYEIAGRDGDLASLWCECEPYQKKPTHVFAYLAYPGKTRGRSPAIVLVHGGGGRAFAEWAEMWARRGYVALAMDLEGNGPDGKASPDPWPTSRFECPQIDQTWNYHSVAAVIRAISLVSSLPEVDPDRIGITGISWGGYLTCIVAGLDKRIRAAVPVYGCGFIHESSQWLDVLRALPEDQRETWIRELDPSSYLGNARMPMLFICGTNDPAYWLDAYQKSYRLVHHRALCMRVNMHHSHKDGWAPVEIGLFMDQHLRGGKPLPEIHSAELSDGTVTARIESTFPIRRAELHFTTDTGPWRGRTWQTRHITGSGSALTTELPDARPIAFFLTVEDSRGALVSTEHEVLER